MKVKWQHTAYHNEHDNTVQTLYRQRLTVHVSGTGLTHSITKNLSHAVTHKHAENSLYLKTAQEHCTVTSTFPTNLMFLNIGEKNMK